MSDQILVPYGVAYNLLVPLYNVTGIGLSSGLTIPSSNFRMNRDNNETDAPDAVISGSTYYIPFSVADMTSKQILVNWQDSATTKTWLGNDTLLETYGHVLSQHPGMGSTNQPFKSGNAVGTPTTRIIKTNITADLNNNGLEGRTVEFIGTDQTALILQNTPGPNTTLIIQKKTAAPKSGPIRIR